MENNNQAEIARSMKDFPEFWAKLFIDIKEENDIKTLLLEQILLAHAETFNKMPA